MIANMMLGPTFISHGIDALRSIIFWLCIAISVGAFSVLIYTLVDHHRSKSHKTTPFHSSLAVEIIWAVIPFLMVVAMLIPATIGMMTKQAL